MKHLYIKDRETRFKYPFDEIKIKTLKYLLNQNSLSISQRLFFNHKIAKLKKITKIKNRCAVTFRNRGIQRHFGMSRNMIRNYINNGLIMEYKKAVW